MSKRLRGFTLVELLLVIAVVAILFMFLLPALQKVHYNSNRSYCKNNLKQIGLATHASNDAFGSLPPLAASSDLGSLAMLTGPYQTTDTGMTLFMWLLPYIEQANLYNSIQNNGAAAHTVGGPDGTNPVYKTVVATYICPTDPSSPGQTTNGGFNAVGNYLANYLVFGDPDLGVLYGNAHIPGSFIDGTSNTIMYSEGYGNCTFGDGYLNATTPIIGAGTGGSAWNEISGGAPPSIAVYAYLPAMCTSSSNPTAGTGFSMKATTALSGANNGNAAGSLQVFSTVAGLATTCSFSPAVRNPLPGGAVGNGLAFQTAPAPAQCNWGTVQSGHPGGVNVSLGDGSVRFVSGNITITTWNNACDRRDGNVLTGDW